ncbi:DUF3131 domain-containing protein [Ramlibacter algicola]|uniref:DUF3131 domain-containing protein n=1 Tax=Ramlibacter algicola TaxID=2795217 RepID=A0A934Q062_9BURK|nr:DUF3131 domain-containing protein [Ramlibacter algicola]MBK0392356.1 DUF3131 domain-containing protein [Ramlibacter algicola]
MGTRAGTARQRSCAVHAGRRVGVAVLKRRTLLAAAPLSSLLAGCGVVGRPASAPGAPKLQASPVAGLSAQEFQWARTAWRYVENNTDFETGLVGGLDRSVAFTAANAGDALAAILAAHELKVIDAHEFDLRSSRLLGFLATMDLSQGQLPNKAYSAATRKMIGFDGRPADIGWSATDVGRLLLWLRIVGQRHARFQEYVDKVVVRWTFCKAIDDCGKLTGSGVDGAGHLYTYPEGRLGDEQLAAAGYAAWGFDTRASSALPALAAVNMEGLALRYDARDPRTSGAQAPVLTMPYVLTGVELGWGDRMAPLRELAQQVHQVQEGRWRREKQLTARTAYQLTEAPYVVLDSVYASGYPWNTIGTDGKEHEKLAQVSTKAAFGLWALWPGEYTAALLENVRHLYDVDRGWYEGRFEQGGAPNTTISLTTNAQVLEMLLFKATGGPLLPKVQRAGFFDVATQDRFNRQGRCWPAERAACKPG